MAGMVQRAERPNPQMLPLQGRWEGSELLRWRSQALVQDMYPKERLEEAVQSRLRRPRSPGQLQVVHDENDRTAREESEWDFAEVETLKGETLKGGSSKTDGWLLKYAHFQFSTLFPGTIRKGARKYSY